MAVTDKAWDGSASRWPDTPSYCDSCAINTNTGDRANWTLDSCKLPYKEPNGDINTNALSSAAGSLNGARGGLRGVSPQDRKKAARTLMRAYSEANLPPPAPLKNMAQ